MKSRTIKNIFLIECRRSLGYTQEQVAKLVKQRYPGLRISAKHIGALERDINKNVTLNVIRALSELYKQPMDHLFRKTVLRNLTDVLS